MLLHRSLLAFALSVSSVWAQDGYASTHGGTNGGKGGTTTTVSAAATFQTAVKSNTAKVVYLAAPISLSSQASVGNNTSIIGVGTSGVLNGGGLKINAASNVIVRNLVINKVLGNDAITLTRSNNVWIDHNEFYSDTAHGPDYYDGQVDITHACDYMTVSNNYFHDHFKSSLVGSDPNGASEDTGKFHLTYHSNHWNNIHTRTPAMRFGHVHIYNNYYTNVVSQDIHSRSGNQVLVEANVFSNSTEPLSTYGFVIPDDSPNTSPAGDYEADGYANLGAANDWGTGKINVTKTGDFTPAKIPYSYTLLPLNQVASSVTANSGVGKI